MDYLNNIIFDNPINFKKVGYFEKYKFILFINQNKNNDFFAFTITK